MGGFRSGTQNTSEEHDGPSPRPALLQHRFGRDAVENLHAALLPVVGVRGVDLRTHDRAVTRWRQQARRELSLVDVTSFVVTEDLAIRSAFASDDDFTAEGFQLAT